MTESALNRQLNQDPEKQLAQKQLTSSHPSVLTLQPELEVALQKLQPITEAFGREESLPESIRATDATTGNNGQANQAVRIATRMAQRQIEAAHTFSKQDEMEITRRLKQEVNPQYRGPSISSH